MGKRRVVHIIRHAQSNFNALSDNAFEGFFPHLKTLDANLSNEGVKQAQKLRHKIKDKDSKNDRYSIKRANLVITSPLTRAIRTALISMPIKHYNYTINPHITEQVENTSDIGVTKNELTEKFQELKEQIITLPDAWWWRHPSRHNMPADPYIDAEVLLKHNGKEPAAESKLNVRKRSKLFIDWLYDKPQLEYDNIVIFSHCCYIKELEAMILFLNGETAHYNPKDDSNSLPFLKNTEIRTYDLPSSFEIDLDELNIFFNLNIAENYNKNDDNDNDNDKNDNNNK